MVNLCDDHEIDDISSTDDSSECKYMTDDRFKKVQLEVVSDLPYEECQQSNEEMMPENLSIDGSEQVVPPLDLQQLADTPKEDA